MTRNFDQDCFENLASAIVLQAANDYRLALKVLKRNPNHTEAIALKKDCEDFFRSKWFNKLTDLDGELLITRLSKEVA